ncbi:hypothetical protein RFI_29002 [Reticulomyxa filosa]|uniref:Uncharacterized protein n=1 Tax=Reticulomyxa filosa TaxID=46433 RepID=X6M354_RETFI|nr:hypothetical protein RFI_29002 [Reticulomyxa filosa]|eukprot:ETO08388.1 hypothetical protein RFI_29002 [Reticulomyxa filosa]
MSPTLKKDGGKGNVGKGTSQVKLGMNMTIAIVVVIIVIVVCAIGCPLCITYYNKASNETNGNNQKARFAHFMEALAFSPKKPPTAGNPVSANPLSKPTLSSSKATSKSSSKAKAKAKTARRAVIQPYGHSENSAVEIEEGKEDGNNNNNNNDEPKGNTKGQDVNGNGGNRGSEVYESTTQSQFERKDNPNEKLQRLTSSEPITRPSISTSQSHSGGPEGVIIFVLINDSKLVSRPILGRKHSPVPSGTQTQLGVPVLKVLNSDRTKVLRIKQTGKQTSTNSQSRENSMNEIPPNDNEEADVTENKTFHKKKKKTKNAKTIYTHAPYFLCRFSNFFENMNIMISRLYILAFLQGCFFFCSCENNPLTFYNTFT